MDKKRIEMNEETKKLLSSDALISKDIDVRGRKYYPREFLSDKGFKSVVWKGADEYGTPVVIKLATYEDYLETSYVQEASRAAKLRPHNRFFAYFHDADIQELDFSGKKVKCVCFIEEWVDGKTLGEYLEYNVVTSSFVKHYVVEMCKVLNILKSLDLRHDDLHPGNVMIATPKPEALSEEFTVKIIDMGSLKPYSAPLSSIKQGKDDHLSFIEHLVLLCNAMLWGENKRPKPMTLVDARFRQEVIPLLNSMLEEDRQIALFEPSNISSKFNHAYTRAQHPFSDIALKLEDPFDYISAEHIYSDRLLVQLFADSCPWAKEVTSPNPVLLTGPRGCGKSMLFRRLSLKALLYRSGEEIKQSRIAGFYVSCSADLRNRFGWIGTEQMARRFHKEIIHYFNALLTREVVQTLLYISQRPDREDLFGFGEGHEKDLHVFLLTKLNIKDEKRFRLHGVRPLEHLLDVVESEMRYCYEQFLRGFNIESWTPLSFLSDFTKYLKEKIPFLNERTITFLLDDFSVHRISEPVQQILNPIIWDRQATHIFKLSAEKYGAERIIESNSESAPTADVTREFREIDCGQYFIALNDKNMLKDLVEFSKDLLDHRLRLAGYKADSETIIGHSSHTKGSLGREIRYNPKAKDHYHGLESITEICSGDISAVLEIYRNIFAEARVAKDTDKPVPKHQQHTAITAVSKRFLELIKTFHPDGARMYQIVLNFGTLCRKILCEGKEMEYRNGEEGVRLVPCETTRIEVDHVSGKSEEWTEEQLNLMKELVRRSIFIEMEPGRGRRSLGPTLRWQLRRIYAPAFSVGLKKLTAVKWTTSEFKFFLTNPDEGCDKEFERWKGSGKDQMKLPIADMY